MEVLEGNRQGIFCLRWYQELRLKQLSFLTPQSFLPTPQLGLCGTHPRGDGGPEPESWFARVGLEGKDSEADMVARRLSSY